MAAMAANEAGMVPEEEQWLAERKGFPCALVATPAPFAAPTCDVQRGSAHVSARYSRCGKVSVFGAYVTSSCSPSTT
eukprot:6720990-Prymnesium_polylepis.1